MSNQINQIARRIAHWANATSFPVENTAGYCMSGSWKNFYPQLLFPQKTLQVYVLNALVEKLKQLGFYASLDVVPFEKGNGLHMHMRMVRIRSN